MVVEIDSESLYDALDEKEVPKCIKFYTPSCMPCKMMTPIVESLANQKQGKVKFFQLNVEDAPEIAEYFGINSVPAFLFTNDDGERHIKVGAMHGVAFSEAIAKHCGA